MACLSTAAARLLLEKCGVASASAPSTPCPAGAVRLLAGMVPLTSAVGRHRSITRRRPGGPHQSVASSGATALCTRPPDRRGADVPAACDPLAQRPARQPLAGPGTPNSL